MGNVSSVSIMLITHHEICGGLRAIQTRNAASGTDSVDSTMFQWRALGSGIHLDALWDIMVDALPPSPGCSWAVFVMWGPTGTFKTSQACMESITWYRRTMHADDLLWHHVYTGFANLEKSRCPQFLEQGAAISLHQLQDPGHYGKRLSVTTSWVDFCWNAEISIEFLADGDSWS